MAKSETPAYRTVKTVNVLVKKTGDGFRATVIGVPDCAVEAQSRREAIRLAREAVVRFMSEGELVRIEIQSPSPARSLRDFAGMWSDDDTFDEFKKAMEAYRQDADADETAP